MNRKYKAIYDESTDTYTIESLTKSRKTKMNDVVGNITPSDLKIIEKAMEIVIVAYEVKPNKKDKSADEEKPKIVNKKPIGPVFGANNI